jgi:hypothetical protein
VPVGFEPKSHRQGQRETAVELDTRFAHGKIIPQPGNALPSWNRHFYGIMVFQTAGSARTAAPAHARSSGPVNPQQCILRRSARPVT